MNKITIFWFRRDLRLKDNAGLFHALKSGYPVLPLFIFDTEIIDKLEDKADARVEFILNSLLNIQEELSEIGSTLLVKKGSPIRVWQEIITHWSVAEVYTNNDYEAYALNRDKEIAGFLKTVGIKFKSFKDQVIFEKNEVVKDNNQPYTVFTPYSRKWKSKLNEFYLNCYPCQRYFSNFYKTSPLFIPSLDEVGFKPAGIDFPSKTVKETIVKEYTEQRNLPAVEGTSRIGIHLRFGTVSIRELAARAKEINETYLNELIWREFFMSILYHFPQVEKHCFKKEYENINWRNNEIEFERWCNGNTGYPIVDAGMRELNRSGFMHNRVRLIVASFLCKHLLIDWRWGETYFAKKLLDYELASNNGNWQWSAGCGCDAAPYFRVFNPYIQTEKFDKQLKYIKKWVPEFQKFSYPRPIVEHDFARKRAIATYSEGLGKSKLV